MHDATDMDLLRQYAGGNSDTAFAALVSRHVNLVYSAALRKAGNPHAAEEITQAVFIILAQKAGRIPGNTILPGWLYQTARLTAAGFLKREIRRVRREQEAYMQTELHADAPDDETWQQLAPLLEDAMGQLGEKDRAAVVLRFFGGKSFAEVATAAGVSENAAKKRVGHALEKLRKFFMKRGIASTAETIAGAISAHSVQAAPVALAKSVTAVAIAKGAVASGSTLTLIKGALKIMAWTKAKTAVVSGVVVLLAAGTTTITVKNIETRNSWRVSPANFAALDRVPPQVRILPTKFPGRGGYGATGGKMMGIGESIESIAQVAYASPSEYNWDSARMIVSPDLPRGRYDFIANLPKDSWLALQKEMERKFGVVGRRETREMDVLRLTVKRPNAPGLKPSAAESRSNSSESAGEFNVTAYSMYDVAVFLERALGFPIVDQSGLTGKFDFDLRWNKADPKHDSLKQALLDQLGLELVSSREPIEMLVVEKAK